MKNSDPVIKQREKRRNKYDKKSVSTCCTKPEHKYPAKRTTLIIHLYRRHQQLLASN